MLPLTPPTEVLLALLSSQPSPGLRTYLTDHVPFRKLVRRKAPRKTLGWRGHNAGYFPSAYMKLLVLYNLNPFDESVLIYLFFSMNHLKKYTSSMNYSPKLGHN